MSSKRYTDEFKTEAIKQITERGYSVQDVASRLGVKTHSLYAWLKKYGQEPERTKEIDSQQAEIQRLRAELKRVTEERDILKKATLGSTSQLEDERLLGLIKQFWLESGGVYGYRKIYLDLRSVGEVCGINKVARLMKQAGLKAQVGYKRPRHKSGKPAVLAENHLKQEFDVDAPN